MDPLRYIKQTGQSRVVVGGILDMYVVTDKAQKGEPHSFWLTMRAEYLEAYRTFQKASETMQDITLELWRYKRTKTGDQLIEQYSLGCSLCRESGSLYYPGWCFNANEYVMCWGCHPGIGSKKR